MGKGLTEADPGYVVRTMRLLYNGLLSLLLGEAGEAGIFLAVGNTDAGSSILSCSTSPIVVHF